MMMKYILSLFFVFFLFGCSSKHPPLPTVQNVELDRYIGSWYEIARFEHFFEKGCKNVTATYKIKQDGDIKVINRCTMIEDNEKKEAVGVAYAADSTNSKLRVSFFRPFYGDYQIIALGKNYEYALVGSPNKEYLWILSRTKTISDTLKNKLIKKAQTLGFDTDQFIWTIQE